jgi:hypothetical protein
MTIPHDQRSGLEDNPPRSLRFSDPEEQLRKKTAKKQDEICQRPSDRSDGRLEFAVGEIKARERCAELHIDPILFEFSEAQEGIPREDKSPDKGEGVSNDAKPGTVKMYPGHEEC